jgi:hypothetical protein
MRHIVMPQLARRAASKRQRPCQSLTGPLYRIGLIVQLLLVLVALLAFNRKHLPTDLTPPIVR